MATVPPLTIDTESLRDVVRTAEDIRNAVVRQIKLHAIAAEGLREVERARAKHGEQRGIPDGTGPDVRLEQLEPVGAGAPRSSSPTCASTSLTSGLRRARSPVPTSSSRRSPRRSPRTTCMRCAGS
jgi:hypothetical protein